MAQMAEENLKRAAATQGAGDVSAHEEQLPVHAAAAALHSVMHEGRLQLTVMIGAREQVSTLFKRLMNPRVVHLHELSGRRTACCALRHGASSLCVLERALACNLSAGWHQVTPIAALTTHHQ